ncbi:MAG: thioesterase [Gudongella sp.]|nr:thioesterase [Gudongella sp.]
MSKYWKEFTIPYYDTDGEGYIRPENILAYMAETSNWHSDSLEVGFSELSKHGHAWMLLRWEAEIVKYPRAKDRVRVGTWTSSFDRFYATREFVLTNEEGILLAKATTKWFFLDIKRRRPKRIPEDLQRSYSFVEEFNFPDFTEMKDLDGDIAESGPFRARRSDIDNNNHVNNIRYIEWLQEGLGEEIYLSKRIQRLGIIYKKEVLLGDSFSTGFIMDEDRPGHINHVISVDGETNALGYTQWAEKGLLE